jgi:hypothetical protein
VRIVRLADSGPLAAVLASVDAKLGCTSHSLHIAGQPVPSGEVDAHDDFLRFV